jgi:4-amino-4-deoxy-L-arabinose transferase-like glycosyltransferase
MFSKNTFLNNLPLILIVFLSFLVRFIFIDKVPNAVGGDELTYAVNARAMFLTGSDISGTWNPLSGFIFQYPAYTLPQAELPYFLISPFVGILGFSLFSVRIIFVLLSVGTVLTTYLIGKALFSKNAGIFAGFVAAFNPWSIYMGRTSYETTPAVFFYLLAFYMLLVLKGKKILWTIPVFFLAFYSYVGTKTSFLPFVLVTILFSYLFINKKKYLKEYLTVFLSSVLLVILFALVVFTTSGQSRTGELINFNHPSIAQEVDYIRKVSIQNHLTPLFENKVTIFLRVLLTKLFKSFSFDYLFVFGDQFFSILRHGFFYVLDALFLIIGLAATYRQRKSTFFLLSALSVIGVIPQLLYSTRTDNFSIHLSLMFAILPIFIGVGIWETLTLIKNKMYFYLTLGITILLYVFLIFNFLNIYFYQFPLNGYFDFHVRLMSKYISLAKEQGKDVIVYTAGTPDVFKKHIFYSDNYNKNNYLEIRKIYRSQKFKFEGIEFSGCDRTIDPLEKNAIVVYDFNCGGLKETPKHLALPRLSDGGQSYMIFNDAICSKYSLKRYPSNLSINDFSIEKMSAEKFCETFVTSL